MIVTIHYLDSKKDDFVNKFIRNNFPSEEIVAETFDYYITNPMSIFRYYSNRVRDKIDKESVKIIGYCWGGFFAYCLNAKYKNAKTILINPSLNPHFYREYNNKIFKRSVLKGYMRLYSNYLYETSNKCYTLIGNKDNRIDHFNLTYPYINYKNNIISFDMDHGFCFDEQKDLRNFILGYFR